MRQVVSHFLWIGHAGDGRDYRKVIAANVRAVMQVAAEEAPLQPPRDLIVCRFPIVDGSGNNTKVLDLAITTLAHFLERRMPTFICCGGGLSRAPAIAAAALSVLHREPPEECLRRITEHHPADVVPGLWEEVVSVLACRPLLPRADCADDK